MITWDEDIMYTDLFVSSSMPIWLSRQYYFLAHDFYEEQIADHQMLELTEY